MSERLPHAGFPSDETLAAFIDGRLDAETRRRVVEHIATCPECSDVVLAAHAMRDETAARTVIPFRRRGLGIAALAAAAAAIVFAIFFVPAVRERILPHPKSGLAALADAAPPQRNIEGRLSGFPYRPLKPVTRGAEDEDTSAAHLKLLSVAAQIAADAEKNPTPENLHAYGVSLLMLGKWDQAVAKLEEALRKETGEENLSRAIQNGTDPGLLNDLSAGYYARSRAASRLQDGLAAVSAAERAFQLQPSSATAFNRALAIELVHGRDQAEDAWKDYLAIEKVDRDWRREGAAHVSMLDQHTGAEPGNVGQLRALVSVGSLHGLGKVAQASFHQSTAFVVEELLPGWAQAVESHHPADADRDLSAAQEIGTVIASQSGDQFVSDCVTAIRRAMTRRDQSLRLLVSGHRQYAAARLLFRSEEIPAAEQRFREATVSLRRAGSPLAFLAWRYVAASQIYEKRYAVAVETLRAAADLMRDSRARYPGVYGQLKWADGVAKMDLGYPQEAVIAYEVALRCFESARQPENVAGVHGLLADGLSYVGDGERAWAHRQQAIQALNSMRDSDRFFPTATEAADAALADGYLASARLFDDLVVAYARKIENPILISDALVDRSRTLVELKRIPEAQRDLEDAKRAAARIPDEGRRRAAETTALLGAAEVAAANNNFESALGQLRDVLAFRASKSDAYATASLFERIGDLEARRGNGNAAVDAYTRGSLELEVRAAGLKDTLMRSRYVARWDRLDRDRAAMLWTLGRRLESWAVSDAGRTRSWYRGSTPHSSYETESGRELARVQRELPKDVTLLELSVFPRRTVAWLITSHDISYHNLPIGGAEVERDLRSLHIAHDQNQYRSALAQLYDGLIRPLQINATAHELIVVPDKILRTIPFAALFDRGRRRYLIEQFPVTVVPSAALYVECRIHDRVKTVSARSILIASNDDANGLIRPLPSVEKEIGTVAHLYEDVAIMRSAGLEKNAFLQAAGSHTIVHFAGHGMRNSVFPEFSSLLLNSSDPPINLYAHEIAASTLRCTRVVVLSSCATRGADVGEQAMIGLPEAFLAASVVNVVSAVDRVNDDAAAAMVASFHAHFASGQRPAIALCEAQRDAIRHAVDVRDWAPWQVSGTS